jgi:hypothetical protein
VKRIIATLLLVALVSGGLGGLAYAQEDPDNEVSANFGTYWDYDVPGDIFTNGAVVGRESWEAGMYNDGDETGAPVINGGLSLASGLLFDAIYPEPATMGPPLYEWFFGDVPEESWGFGADVGSNSPEVFPVTFTPGFDASRSVDKNHFTEPDIQTLTITLTPREVEVTERFMMTISALEDDLVNPVITSPTTDEEQGIHLDPDGHWLSIDPTGLELNTTYTYYVTIEVTPKVAEVEFMPWVYVRWFENLASGTAVGSSVSYPAGEVSTWTLSATGSYEWHWFEFRVTGVSFEAYSIEIEEPLNRVFAHFNTMCQYDVTGDSFTNTEVTGWRWWWATLHNPEDETGAPITGLNLSLDTELALDNFWAFNGDLETEGPPVYEWSFDDVAEGEPWPYLPHVGVQCWGSPHPFPVTFTPGFNASRSVDRTEFLQSEGTQTQTLTISLTPLEQELAEINVQVPTWLCQGLVDAVINPPTGEGEFDFAMTPDGQTLWIWPMGQELGEEWTTTVTIEVTPKVGKVAFMPYVHTGWFENLTSGYVEGNSVSYLAGNPADGIGTWTWSAIGSYIWDWNESVERFVVLGGLCEDITELAPHEPMTGDKLVATGEFGSIQGIVQTDIHVFFTNPDCVSEITIDRVSIIRDDGGVLYEGPLSGLNYFYGPYVGDVLGPHQTAAFSLRRSLPDGNGGWLSEQDALAMPLHTYTVEIFYSVSKRRGLPLIGRVTQLSASPGNELESVGMLQMVNMEQRLKPRK